MSEARHTPGGVERAPQGCEPAAERPASPGGALERILEQVGTPAPAATPEARPATRAAPAPATALPMLGTARVVRLLPHRAVELARRDGVLIRATVAPEVDTDLVETASRDGQSALIEWQQGEEPLLVGIVQTRAPEELRLRGRKIELEASEEVLIRTGRAGLRLERDGEIELRGGRISAVSRGVFRLVGRMLRLN